MNIYFCVHLHSLYVTGSGQTHWICIIDLILITNDCGKHSHSMGGVGEGGRVREAERLAQNHTACRRQHQDSSWVPLTL